MKMTKKALIWILLLAAALSLPAIARADAVHWSSSTTSTSGYVFTSAEMATMKYYVRINRPNPLDTTGRVYSSGAAPGTWYYIGEVVNATSWPSNNQLSSLLISYGFAGQAVQFTVSQAFTDNGVEYDSGLSNIATWTSDAAPPFVSGFSIDNGAIGVPVGTTSFSFTYGDGGLYSMGAKLSALSVTCPGYLTTKTCATGMTCSGTSAAYLITVPGLSLGYDNVVSCTIAGEDLEDPPNTMSVEFGFTVQSDNAAVLTIETTTLPDAQVGDSIYIPLVISGGQSGATCDNTGVLPPGVPLHDNCAIGPGVLSTAETYAFTVTATDPTGATDNQAYSWTILPGTPGGKFTVVIQDNADTYINSGSPTVNYSTSDEGMVYVWPGENEANVYLYQGTTAGAGDNADILSATLFLDFIGHEGAGYDNMVLYVQKVTGSLNLDNVTWSNFGATRGAVVSSQVVGLDNGSVGFDITSIFEEAYLDSKASYILSVGSGTQGRQDQNRIIASAQHANAALRPRVVVTGMRMTAAPGTGVTSVPARGKFRLGGSGGSGGSKPKHFQ